MNTSRPQQRAQPAVKCGSPAASEGVGLPGSSEALWTMPCIWTAQSARSCVNACPDTTKSDICSTAARRAALYAAAVMIAKYFGRRNGGTPRTRAKRSSNHAAGAFRFGNVLACLAEKRQPKIHGVG
jgi:hypothetical protein